MLRRLARLGARRSALAVCAVGWVVVTKAALVAPGGSFTRRRRRLDRLAARLPPAPPCTVDEAAWAVTRAARLVPGTRCLEWALALRGLLAHAGIAAELRIGVAGSRRGDVRAHAWLDCGGRTLSWGVADGYTVLAPSAAFS
jgi:hypothetical protein